MIRLLTAIAGTPMHHAGDVISLPPAIETAWVAIGMAERVEDAPETAAASVPETAMRPRKGRRRV